MKGLAQSELLHSLHQQQAAKDLQRKVDQAEKELLNTRMEVDSRTQKILQKEEQYRDADAARLDKIRQQVSHSQQVKIW